MADPSGLDDTKYTLTEHLGELRGRLAKALGAVVLTTCVAAYFSPAIFDYSIEPLSKVLRDKNRVETILVHARDDAGKQLAARLDDHDRVVFRGIFTDLADVSALVQAGIDSKHPIDLVLVSASAIGDDGALVSDLLEDVEPPPYVAYLVTDAKDPAVQELQLEGAVVILAPPRSAVLNRVVRRAAGTAGKATGDKIVVLSPLDPFFAYLKIALICGLFLACPIWLYQLWRFVAPGLYMRERRFVGPIITSASLLFVGGGLFAYYAMFPVMFDVLVNQMMPASLASSFTADNYLGLLIRMTVAFGVVFELPLILAMLSVVGIVSAEGLRKWRKYAIVIAFVLGALLTPADPMSQVMMALPLVLFYEVGIIAAAILGKKRTEKQLAPVEAD